jgi:hypothetical protein
MHTCSFVLFLHYFPPVSILVGPRLNGNFNYSSATEGMSGEYFKDDGLFPRARPIYVKRQEILIRPI